MNCVVYALFSTETGEIRYIGQTTKPVSYRLGEHIRSALAGGTWPICKWIRKAIGGGFAVEAVILVLNAVWNETEIKLIAGYRANGARLLNATAGGKGFVGMKRTAEARRKMSRAALRRVATPEGIENCRKGGLANRKHPPKKRRTLSEASKQWARDNPDRFRKFQQAGVVASHTKECNKRTSKSVKALWKNPEYRERQTLSAKLSWTPEKREAARIRATGRKGIS